MCCLSYNVVPGWQDLTKWGHWWWTDLEWTSFCMSCFGLVTKFSLCGSHSQSVQREKPCACLRQYSCLLVGPQARPLKAVLFDAHICLHIYGNMQREHFRITKSMKCLATCGVCNQGELVHSPAMLELWLISNQWNVCCKTEWLWVLSSWCMYMHV